MRSELQASHTNARDLKPSDWEILNQLPVPPAFDYFKSSFPLHDARPLLPNLPGGKNWSPLALFALFFGDSILDSIVTNTNRYAEVKRFPSIKAVKAFPSQKAEGLG